MRNPHALTSIGLRGPGLALLAALLWAAAAEGGTVASLPAPRRPVVIAHRGACGYLPEHTLVAKAYAHATGPDFIEQDVVLTRDGVPVVLHDHTLDDVTDVAQVFPGRMRRDGHTYAIDFTLAEIRRLTVHERVDLKTGLRVFPGRFPADLGLPLRVPTLDEEVRLIKGLNASTGRTVGLYVELKAPGFHRREGHDLVGPTLAVLTAHGYTSRDSAIWIQSFDPFCLKSLRRVHKSPLRLLQLVGPNVWRETPGVDHERMLTPAGLAEVARYADAIGPSIDQLIEREGAAPRLRRDIVERAHALGLHLHPYTIRTDELPTGLTLDALVGLLFDDLRVDGVFTDFPDRVITALRVRSQRSSGLQ